MVDIKNLIGITFIHNFNNIPDLSNKNYNPFEHPGLKDPCYGQGHPPFNLGIYLVHCVKRFEQTLSNIKLLKWLLEKFLTKEDINGFDNIGRNCLHYCVIQDKLVFFHLIFPHIFPETIVGLDKYGLCCLHYAIFLDSYNTVEPLAVRLEPFFSR